jgi:isopentenyl-diphosphate delta-isomerase
MAAHREGRLHRACSVFVFDTAGSLLLQQRAPEKYHSAGLWSNTCCTHPAPGESPEEAAHRRLDEEMGFDCQLRWAFGFVYRVPLDHELTEHEYDHVFVGHARSEPQPDAREVSAWRWADATTIQREMREHPETYTEWFKLAFPRVLATQA